MSGPASALSGSPPGDQVLRILAVDDDIHEFPLLEASFAACGVDVQLDTVTTGHIAIARLLMADAAEPPQLAMVDVGMPLISGFELAHQLIMRGIPTVLMSALVTPERCAQAQALGALDLLEKPPNAAGYARMAARVLHLLGRPAPRARSDEG